MKRIRIIAIIWLTTAFAGCYRDTGNYDYRDLNEVAISNIASSYSRVRLVHKLYIEPGVSMSDATKDSTAFDYHWVVMKSATVIDTIGRSRVLNYQITLPPDTYILLFKMIDKETKVNWMARTSFVVTNPYARGLLLIGEDDNGNVEADMITMVADTLILKNLLSKSGLPTMKEPYQLMHTGGSGANTKLWVLTGTGSYYLDRPTFTGIEANNFRKLVNTTDGINTNLIRPMVIAPQLRDRAGNSGSTAARAMLSSDGDIFTTSFAANGGDFYGNPINRDINNASVLLKAAPFLSYPIGVMSAMVWYDTDNQRFMYYPNFSSKASLEMEDNSETDPFPWNQGATGRTLIYAENTRNTDGGSPNGNSFAIMRDNSNNHFIYKYYADGVGKAAKRNLYTVKSMATDFDKATHYAFSSRRTVIFYSVGSTLYAYDYNVGNEKIYQFPEIGSDPISMLKFDTQIEHTVNSLYIGTYNATNKGMLKQYLVGTNPDFVDLTPAPRASWSGLVKIKNMSWRAVN